MQHMHTHASVSSDLYPAAHIPVQLLKPPHTNSHSVVTFQSYLFSFETAETHKGSGRERFIGISKIAVKTLVFYLPFSHR